MRWAGSRECNDETTLNELLGNQGTRSVGRARDEIVKLTLVTTARKLKDLDDELVKKVKAWRHYIAAMRYLRNKRDMCLDSEEREVLNGKLERFTPVERLAGENIRKMLWDFERWVNGAKGEIFQEEKETPEAREQDIEARFERWIERKKEIMPKPSEAKDHQDQESWFILETVSDVEFDFPPIADGKEKIFSHSLRDELGRLMPESDGFVLRSGVLLWGQLHTVFAGSMDPGFQGSAESLPPRVDNGRIPVPIGYRSAARNGVWKVRKTFSNSFSDLVSPKEYSGMGEPNDHFGWIIYHEDVDALEVVERCSRITARSGRAYGNGHTDKVSTSSVPSNSKCCHGVSMFNCIP